MRRQNSFAFTEFAEKKFRRMDRFVQERIRSKLRELKHHDDIGSVLKPLKHFQYGSHRLRIGQYRVIVKKISECEYWVVDLGNRSDIYK